MKKNLLILLCIIFPIASNAQDVFESSEQLYPSPRTYRNYVKPGVHPYLRTGVSCNDYTSVQVRGIKSVWGFAAEAGVDFFFTDTSSPLCAILQRVQMCRGRKEILRILKYTSKH